MNKPAMRAKLRASVARAEKRLRELHAMRDWERIKRALPDYWRAKGEWRGVA